MALLGLERADHLLSMPSLHVLTFNGAIAQASPRSRSPARHTPLASTKAHSLRVAAQRPSSVQTQLRIHYTNRPRERGLAIGVYAMLSRVAATKGARFLMLRCARRVNWREERGHLENSTVKRSRPATLAQSCRQARRSRVQFQAKATILWQESKIHSSRTLGFICLSKYARWLKLSPWLRYLPYTAGALLSID